MLRLFLLACTKEVTFPASPSFLAASWTSPACGFVSCVRMEEQPKFKVFLRAFEFQAVLVSWSSILQ